MATSKNSSVVNTIYIYGEREREVGSVAKIAKELTIILEKILGTK